jgi:hypothetical protein
LHRIGLSMEWLPPSTAATLIGARSVWELCAMILIQITRPTAPRSIRSTVFKLWRRCPAKVLPARSSLRYKSRQVRWRAAITSP